VFQDLDVGALGIPPHGDAPAQIESWTPETRRPGEIYILDRGKILGIP